MNKKYIITAIIVSILFFGGGMFTAAVLQELNREPDAPAPTAPTKPVLADTDDLWRLTNAEREKLGLKPLERSATLDTSAVAKCADMQAKEYWAHNSPDGKRPYDFFDPSLKYRGAGENLAQNTGDAKSTVAKWMNSPTHRANIVKADYTLVGYAVCDGAVGVVAVQHFVAP